MSSSKFDEWRILQSVEAPQNESRMPPARYHDEIEFWTKKWQIHLVTPRSFFFFFCPKSFVLTWKGKEVTSEKQGIFFLNNIYKVA